MGKPSIPKGLTRVANLFKVSSLILVIMGASCSFGVGVGEMSLKGAVTVLLFLGAVGIFFLYLSGQLLSFKKWAKNVCLIISVLIAIFFTYGMISSLFRDPLQTSTLGLAFLLLPTIFFYLSSFYLTRSEVKELFK